ncbi:SufE family protein [Pseudidiomarina andamanensis]|uniref:SufE family protein n=1 Tax=Pseudidiomarina andamanensis TaxID=1940690 RepID=A0AA92IMP8_9GAMM|nr:SufE family protein [Pseudidiomarina andamanensis]MDS0217684.1 SufE family protein [Pseudidiomarina andamanensis]QGT96673.1 SufE family protein [Pseudidiomarina andamanensis]
MYGILTESDLSALREQLGSRENRMRYLVQLAKQAEIPDGFRTSEREVFGCEARVWVLADWHADQLCLTVDSESRVVLGLLMVIRQALHGASAEQVSNYSLDDHFDALGLADFVTSSRRNGLRNVIAKLQDK